MMIYQPRRPFDDAQPDGYMESDHDYVGNNHDLAVSLLDAQANTEALTDAQCDEFRRHNGDFNSMVRAIFTAGCEQRQAGQEPVLWQYKKSNTTIPFLPGHLPEPKNDWRALYTAAPQPAAQPDKETEIAALKQIIKVLLPFAEEVQDMGPPGQGWKSDELRKALADAEAAMAQGVQP